MARTNFVKNFDLCIEIPYSTIICSQHIYKTIWIAVVCLELIAKSNVRKEALDYDEFSIAVFKLKKEEKKMNTIDDLALVGHAISKYQVYGTTFWKPTKIIQYMSKLLETKNVKLVL